MIEPAGAPQVASAAPKISSTRHTIELRGVSKRYRGTQALAPMDLEIREGEFFCLLGPSGCGKTTTLNLIGGFVEATSGEIVIQGENVTNVPPHQRNVNTVFQSYALFPHLNVRDNVAFGLKMSRVPAQEAKARTGDALALVRLTEYGDHYPAQLSGGQQQRVAVARALINRPAVLLLDEPLGALDLKLRKQLQVELARIHRDVGTTFVFVTHDQEEAMAMADRIAVMNNGRLEQVGTPEEIYARPNSRFVADFVGESNFFEVERRADGTVVTAGGSPVPCSAGATSGWSHATLMVRPEAIRFSPHRGERLCLEGEVLQSSFLGSFTRVAIACAATQAPVLATLSYGKRHQQQFRAESTVAF
ncbi:MAG TPA: ABC transporter ATP-binding protein, partial [Steroidobacteraceae bacterium]|nr:ABC transporter ATP-binding protein [Steroidobacteraceae bacterium]